MDFETTNRIATLLLKERSGELDQKGRQELLDWRSASQSNEELYQRLCSGEYVGNEMLRYISFRGGNDVLWKRIRRSGRQSRRRRLFLRAGLSGIAAVLAIVMVSILRDGDMPDYLPPDNSRVILAVADGSRVELSDRKQADEWKKYVPEAASSQAEADVVMLKVTVPRGAEYNIVLADGTSVWLNSESELTYPSDFIEDIRRVQVSGEAYFDVATNESRPFIVSVRETEISVLGTSFNTSAYDTDNSVVTTLVRGSVEVSANDRSVVLSAGMQAVVKDGDDHIYVSEVDASLYTSWISGIFDFEDMKLSEICARLTRWYDVDFIFEGNAGDEKFSGGAWMNSSLRDFLWSIEYVTDVRFKHRNGKIVVNTPNK